MFLWRLVGIGGVLKFLGKGKGSFIVLSSLIPGVLFLLMSRIIVRDESILEYNKGKSGIEEMKMLEKMLAEQPPLPRTLKDMYTEYLNNVIVSTYPDPPFERSISHHPFRY